MSKRLSEHAAKNRASWDASSDEYEATHATQLERDPRSWGVWQLPEDELHILGDVEGKDVLELGCGAARWSIALAGLGARVVGLDNSARQLEHARRLMVEAGVDFPLVHASAEDVPLPNGSFDIVFCDHGAMTFADPRRAVPETARLLRQGGLLAFSMSTPLFDICWDDATDHVSEQLTIDYFGMSRLEDAESVKFQLPYGEWIRLFRRNGLAIEDLVEPRPPEGAVTTYEGWPLEWARRWPAEHAWKLRKE